jgi:hypothetical protein
MAAGAVFISDRHPNSFQIFKPRSGFFATKSGQKLHRSANGGNPQSAHGHRRPKPPGREKH